jgi:hypothetical protein
MVSDESEIDCFKIGSHLSEHCFLDKMTKAPRKYPDIGE